MSSNFDDFLGIKYTLTDNENFDKYLDVLGVNFLQRTAIKSVTPVVHAAKNGDEYSFISVTTLKTVETKFVPGVEFDFETLDGRKVKNTITIKGNEAHEVQVESNGRKHTFVRNFTADKLEVTMQIIEADGTVAVTAKRIYKVK